MTRGLKMRKRGTDVIIIDTSVATGGVCLGIVSVPAGGGNFDYPAFATASGIALSAGTGNAAALYSTNHAPGYLRFVFPAASAGALVTLFAK